SKPKSSLVTPLEEFHPRSFRAKIAPSTGAWLVLGHASITASNLIVESMGRRRRSSDRGLAMTSSSRSVEREPGGRPPVIHVVDDDPGFRTAIGDLLRACDYRVELYASA